MSKLTEDEAREKAKSVVFLSMNIGDINDACEERGMRVKTKTRHEKEKRLIEAMTKEFMGE